MNQVHKDELSHSPVQYWQTHLLLDDAGRRADHAAVLDAAPLDLPLAHGHLALQLQP